MTSSKGLFRKKSNLEMLIEALKGVVSVLQREEDSHWTGFFKQHCEKGLKLQNSSFDAESMYEYARGVESVFGGIGSFNDTYYKARLDSLKENLFISVQALLRECWKVLGRKTYCIPMAELLAVGTAVKLIHNEVISIGRDEKTHLAPKSPLTYLVLKRILDDIDGMPRYEVNSDSHIWLARHNALQRT